MSIRDADQAYTVSGGVKLYRNRRYKNAGIKKS